MAKVYLGRDRIDVARDAARILNLLGAPQHGINCLRCRAARLPEIDHKHDQARMPGFVDDRIERRIGNAAAVPIKLSIDLGGWETGR